MTRDSSDDVVKELVRDHWGGRAETFDDEPQHGIHDEAQHEAWLSVLREWTGEPPRRTLDLGCGTGVVSLLLSEVGHDVTGVDLAPDMLERAREKAREAGHAIDFRQGDAEELPFADDAFDLAVARHLVWTLPNPTEALGEWQRVVRPGGTVVLIEGAWDHDDPWDEYEEVHDDLPLYHGRSPDELAGTLLECGFVEVDHEPLMDPVLWGREPRHEYYVMAGTVGDD